MPPPTHSLRAKLLLLLLGTTLPLLLLALANAWVTYQAERDRLERSTEAVARGVAQGVALELQRGLAGLQVLTLSQPLCTGDLAGFRRQLAGFVQSQHPGANAVLADRDGRQLINLLAPAATPLPERRETRWMRLSAELAAPVVSDLYHGTFRERVVTVEVPVSCPQGRGFQLALVPRLEVFDQVLRAQQPGAGWVLVLVDRAFHPIAHLGAGDGEAAGLARAAAGLDDPATGGFLQSGLAATRVVSRVGDFGWSIVIERPLRALNVALARSMLVLLLSAVLLVLLGGAFALSVARGLVGPMERLSRMAQGREAPEPPPLSGVREVDVVASRLHAAMADLRAADRRKDDFIATVAHELRNPLAPLVNALELLRRRERLSLEGERFIAIAERQLRQMRALVQDLLEFSRLGQGRAALDLREFDLRQGLQAAMDDAADRLAEKEQQLQAQLPPSRAAVQADEVRLTQVFTNLLDNAAKYSLPGGTVTVALATDGDGFRVDITDEGIGFEPSQAAHLFEPFWQACPGAPGGSGMGIGLGLVKRLVEAQGGRVAATSPGPGRGSTFSVWLPAAG